MRLSTEEADALAHVLRARCSNDEQAQFVAGYIGSSLYKYRRCKLDFIVYKASETLFLGGNDDLVKARGSLVAYESPSS